MTPLQQQLGVLLLLVLAAASSHAFLVPPGGRGGSQCHKQHSQSRQQPLGSGAGIAAQPPARLQAAGFGGGGGGGGGGKGGKKKQAWTPPKNEFSRCFDLDDVGRKPARMRVEAGEEERAALAERFEFMNLHHLSANISLSRPRWGTLLVEGALRASMDRHCVVTGELFPFEFTADFSTYIKEVGGAVPLYGGGDGDFDAEDEEAWGQGAGELEEDDYDDEVEAGGELDVGEIVAQYAYLLLPPYPTLPGKSLDDIPDEVVFEFGPGELDGGDGGGGGGGKKKKKQKPSW